MNKTKYSISAVSRIIGKSRATISRHCKAGKLSYEIDNDGNKTFEASELIRVYGDACDFEREEKRGLTTKTKRSESKPEDSTVALQAVQKQLVGQYVAQIEHLQLALDKAQDGQNRVTLLLEQRSSNSSTWETALTAMKENIVNETEKQIQQLKESHDTDITKLKRALHRERNKSFWQKLFG